MKYGDNKDQWYAYQSLGGNALSYLVTFLHPEFVGNMQYYFSICYSRGIIRLHYRAEDFPQVIDLLKNEKPLYLH